MNTRTNITKTYLYNFDPLKPNGNTGVYRGTHFVLFLFLLKKKNKTKNINCGYSWEPLLWGGSHEYPQSMFWAEIWNILFFLSENFQFSEVKFLIYLNRCVFLLKLNTEGLSSFLGHTSKFRSITMKPLRLKSLIALCIPSQRESKKVKNLLSLVAHPCNSKQILSCLMMMIWCLTSLSTLFISFHIETMKRWK